MDIYTIPFEDQILIYRPLRRLAFAGNQALANYIEARALQNVRNEEIESFFVAIGFDRPGLSREVPVLGEDGPCPTGAVLLMTNRCNLRCVYCYANAGNESRLAEMSWPLARRVVDHVVENARKTQAAPSLTFHGGGEPTLLWDLMTQVVEHARASHPDMKISMSSNGVWNEMQRKFICENFSNISLSMDGVPGVQDRQRPFAEGSGSAERVWESMEALNEAGVDYGVRMTVLPDSVDEIADGVAMICGKSNARSIQIEPTFTRSRGKYADIETDFADAFAASFMKAWKVGRSAGREVYFSGARPWVIAPMFCQAPLKAAVATADGRLVTCFEVFSENSPMAGAYTVGRVDENGVKYDRAALQRFLDAQQARRKECVDCFCYWHCAGDCATRRSGPRDINSGRCRATRAITLALLLENIADAGGLWVGLREQQVSIGCDAPDPERSES